MPLRVCLQICYLQINLMAINSKKHCVCKKKNMHRGNLLVSPKRLFVLRASSAQAAAPSKKFRWDKTPMVIMWS